MMTQHYNQWLNLPIEHRRQMFQEIVLTERQQRLVAAHAAGLAGGENDSGDLRRLRAGGNAQMGSGNGQDGFGTGAGFRQCMAAHGNHLSHDADGNFLRCDGANLEADGGVHSLQLRRWNAFLPF